MQTLHPKPGVIARHLKCLPAFRCLADSDFNSLSEEAFLEKCEKGELLFRSGEKAATLHCLVSGSLRIFRILPDGTEKVLHIQVAPSLVAEAPVLIGGLYPAGAECVEECLVVSIPRQGLLRTAMSDSDWSWRMMAGLFTRLRELTDSLASSVQRSAVARVASYLAGLSQGGDVFDLPAPKRDVASYLGLRPESFSRATSALQENGAIRMEGRRIAILDPEALQKAMEPFS